MTVAKRAGRAAWGVGLGVILFVSTCVQPTAPRPADIQINELMAGNATSLQDASGQYPDWIELRNTTDADVDLAGWYLTDDRACLTKWAFPASVIPAGGYLLVFADSSTESVIGDELHASFDLDKGGEYLALVRPDGTTVEHEYATGFPEQFSDVSYGISSITPGALRYFSTPTPGAANAGDYLGAVADTKFSVRGGFHDFPLTVAITTATRGAEIRYTTDCSEPTLTDGTVYTGPITVDGGTVVRAAAFKSGYMSTDVDAVTYLSMGDILVQPDSPAGFPDLWRDTDADYEMDPGFVSAFGGLVPGSLLSLPSIAIVTEMDNLFSDVTGIYSNPRMEDVEWERPASAEWFRADGSTGFNVNCGMRIQGGWWFRGMDLSRKKSFRLLFKGVYGPTRLNFPMFDAEDAVASFDTITLRAGANDAYNNWGDEITQYIRDEFVRRTQLAMGRPASHGTFVHLYLNGLYWGLYNPVERPEASFSASYFGGEKEEWDAVNSGAAVNGTADKWDELLNLCSGIVDDALYQRIQGRNLDGTSNPAYECLLDVENYIDYMICSYWAGNTDWPHKNWYGARRRGPDSTGYKFYNWDTEWTLRMMSSLYADVTGRPDGVAWPCVTLRAHPEFRLLFADHARRHMLDGGPLTPEAAIDRYQSVADQVEPAIIAELARWGDQAGDSWTPDTWENERDIILNDYLPKRTAIVLDQFRSAGLYPNVDAPSFYVDGSEQYGGTFPAGATLSMSAGAGVYYTLDGTDPRSPGGGVSPTAQVWSGSTMLVLAGAVWKYLDDGSDQGTAWYGVGFDDDSWASGPAQLGYGDGDEATVVSYGPDSSDKYVTTYFRHTFSVPDPSGTSSLALRLLRDDGAVVYLNSVEVVRSNMPLGAIDYQTRSMYAVAGTEESVFFAFGVNPDLLVTGDNVLAVEIHQTSLTSSDISFDLAMTATTVVGGPVALTESVLVKARAFDGSEWSALSEAVFVPEEPCPLRVTEIMYHPPDPEGAERSVSADAADYEFIELQNTGNRALNLVGVQLTAGVPFDFTEGSAAALGPGECVIVVRDLDAFKARYGEWRSMNIAGEYSRCYPPAPRLANEGEAIELVDGAGRVIQSFVYDDGWYPYTDGEGFSLTIHDARAEAASWSSEAGWRSSTYVGGSPGQDAP